MKEGRRRVGWDGRRYDTEKGRLIVSRNDLNGTPSRLLGSHPNSLVVRWLGGKLRLPPKERWKR